MENYRVAIITASDSGFANERKDQSGEKIRSLCQAAGFEVVSQEILPDDLNLLSQSMKKICDNNEADLLFTTGGTGLTSRDNTPEATLAIAEKNVPGIAEALRSHSLTITKRAMLGRGVSVLRKKTLIINLPGSLKAVTESLEYLIDQLPHALALMQDQPSASKDHFK